MNQNTILKYALANALWTVFYIILIGSLLYSAPQIFGNSEPNPLIPIIMLMLFVFSAAVTGSLILGRSILWYVDGKKKESIFLLGYTLGLFFVITVLMMVVLYVLK